MNDIFQAIRRRYSARDFTLFPLDRKQQKAIQKIIRTAPVLDKSIKLDWQFESSSPIGSGRIYSMVKKLSNKKLIEYGFQGESILLGLTEIELATCWMASGKAVVQDAPAVIVLGKGTKAGILSSAKRLFIGSNSRKDRETLLAKDSLLPTMEQNRIIDAMRLAPSAVNKQPWRFTVMDKKSILVEKLPGHAVWSYIDFGIVLYHGYIAGKALKKKIRLKKQKEDVYLLQW
ncbi:MAG: nitroreductase family protein [Spirochaetales bacterium]|nr:nitroreductase family protein [Spirochaetales bacterium]